MSKNIENCSEFASNGTENVQTQNFKENIGGEKTWNTIFSLPLSKSKLTSKILCLKHPVDKPDFILVDIRAFYHNGRASRNGVCMTQFEFDQLGHILVRARDIPHKMPNKSGGRILYSVPKPKRAVELKQHVNDKFRKVYLSCEDCHKIIDNFGTIYKMIVENDMKSRGLEFTDDNWANQVTENKPNFNRPICIDTSFLAMKNGNRCTLQPIKSYDIRDMLAKQSVQDEKPMILN